MIIKCAAVSIQGHPSLCYRHDGDGKCEEFEEKTSMKDCGFYTPEGFQDQWAVNVTVNPSYHRSQCPENVIAGPPSRDLVSPTNASTIEDLSDNNYHCSNISDLVVAFLGWCRLQYAPGKLGSSI